MNRKKHTYTTKLTFFIIFPFLVQPDKFDTFASVAIPPPPHPNIYTLTAPCSAPCSPPPQHAPLTTLSPHHAHPPTLTLNIKFTISASLMDPHPLHRKKHIFYLKCFLKFLTVQLLV